MPRPLSLLSAPLPDLMLRQFASLSAELAFAPERHPEILRRYHLRDEAVLKALDAYWGRERATRVEVHMAFTDDFASYMAWLHKHGL